jgi:hypothetical protein
MYGSIGIKIIIYGAVYKNVVENGGNEFVFYGGRDAGWIRII